MKQIPLILPPSFTILLLFNLLFSNATVAKPTRFYNCTWQELKQIALHQQKPIFVEIFDKNIDSSKEIANLLGDAEVSDYYNANFINYRVDFNSHLGAEFKQKYYVSKAPEMLYISSDGLLIYKKTGNKGKDDLLNSAQIAIGRHLMTIETMQQQYENGYRAPAFLYHYAYKMQQKQIANHQIIDEYLQKKHLNKQITSHEDMQFIYDFAANPYTNAFNILCKHKPLFDKKYTTETINQRIENIVIGNVHYAANTHNQKLYLQMQKVVKKSKLPNAEMLLQRMEATYFNTSVEH